MNSRVNTLRPAIYACLLGIHSHCGYAFAQAVPPEEKLRSDLRERDAEIAQLKREIELLKAASTTPGSPAEVDSAGRAPRVSAVERDDETELASALEGSLLRQGGAVLQPGAIALEPELSYFYDETSDDRRRDALGAGLSIRYGLPAAMQIDLSLPYVLRDHQAGADSSSGVGDVRIGLTRQLLDDSATAPALLVFGRWSLPTGDIDRPLPTGTGQHSVQLGILSLKRVDPVVLTASISYLSYLGSARLADGARIDAGDTFGARLGANLAATPDTSFFWGVSYNTGEADRFNGQRSAASDRARAFVELGATRVIGRGRFFNVGVGIGVTPAAPRFAITASFPFLY